MRQLSLQFLFVRCMACYVGVLLGVRSLVVYMCIIVYEVINIHSSKTGVPYSPVVSGHESSVANNGKGVHALYKLGYVCVI